MTNIHLKEFFAGIFVETISTIDTRTEANQFSSNGHHFGSLHLDRLLFTLRFAASTTIGVGIDEYCLYK